MLIMRPNCEACDADLPADAEAMICSFECTFCPDCATDRFDHVCPNCGGDLVHRPKRAEQLWQRFPPSTERVLKPH